MEHCWCILRHQPKWCQHVDMLGKRNKPNGRCPASKVSTPVGDDNSDGNVEVICERSLGKKLAKEMERKRKAIENIDIEFVEALAKMKNDRAMFISERRQAASNMDAARAELLREKKRKNDLEKTRIDMNIMKMDLSSLSGMEYQYFLNLKKEIFEETSKRFSSISPSYSPFPSQSFEDI